MNMPAIAFPATRWLTTLASGGLVLGLAACASTPLVEAQWRSVETPPGYLHGMSVLVVCQTGETVYKRLCEDRVATELGARGAVPVIAASMPVPLVGGPVPAPGAADAQVAESVRASGAKAVFSVTVSPSSTRVSQGVSVGIGGFGFGRGSAMGLGVSAPIGGGQVSTGYSAEARLTDVASGRLMWTARSSTPPSSDANAQLADLTKTSVDAAFGARLF
jgi:hypothetical protein